MLYCPQCRLHLAGTPRRCPLCGGELTGTGNPKTEVFPQLTAQRHRMRLFLRIVSFLSLAAALVCLLVNLLYPGEVWWAGYATAGIGSSWLLLIFALRRRRNIPKTILWLTTIGGLLCVFWDWATGWHGWSVTWLIPILCTAAQLMLILLPQLLRLRFSDYIFYLVTDLFFSVLPVFFYLSGLLRGSLLPSLICCCAGAISLAALAIFRGRELAGEFVRRMHL